MAELTRPAGPLRAVNTLMPCFRCSARQTDPVRGASPWHRVVVGGEQVLVCPACRPSPEWDTILDRCDRCDSTRLAKSLGTVLCRDCGARGAHEQAEPTEQGRRAEARQRPERGRVEHGRVEGGQEYGHRRRARHEQSERRTLEPSHVPRQHPPREDEPARSRQSGTVPEPLGGAGAEGAEKARSAESQDATASGDQPERRGDLAADVDAALGRLFGRPRTVP